MKIFLSYGIIKSASTFSKTLLTEYFNQLSNKKLLRFIELPKLVDSQEWDFVDKNSNIDDIRESISKSELDLTLIKTHSPISLFESDLSEFELYKTANVRHPGDVIVSLIDAAKKDKKLKRNRFDEFDNFESALKTALYQFKVADEWFSKGAYLIKYKDLVSDPEDMLSSLIEGLGIKFDQEALSSAINKINPESVPEYNKGVPDRYLAELTQKQIEMVRTEFSYFIDRFEL
ncbi:MAG: hypothetical protein CMF12_06875 [Idiomarina sp.]|uniref:sulfotransferase domain-containing protein n=1 Tax=Idiomarina sp. TaxID=1874361 RepID=UPI000C61EB5B|nr:sulfotransferase domain-containing protein [Idiomarina sp.]MBT42233.1 hypothetical protein [Idiomarina sp.]